MAALFRSDFLIHRAAPPKGNKHRSSTVKGKAAYAPRLPFAWLGRCRRLAKNWEATIASADAWLLIASIRHTGRRIARA